MSCGGLPRLVLGGMSLSESFGVMTGIDRFLRKRTVKCLSLKRTNLPSIMPPRDCIPPRPR
jgi:hypothetical protein